MLRESNSSRRASRTTPQNFDQLPMATLHGDFNDANILLHGDKWGILDVGDCVHSWRVNDLAIGAAYVMVNRVRSRRPAVLRCLHAIDATRVHQTRSILRPFGPSRATAMLRAGTDENERSGFSTRGDHAVQGAQKFVEGFLQRSTLSKDECRALPHLIAARLATSFTRVSRRPFRRLST